MIVPIQKPGKDPQNSASYTSHLGKTLETIINTRLNYFLEKKIITNTQAGFRRDRQTIDQVMPIENAIKTAEAKAKLVRVI